MAPNGRFRRFIGVDYSGAETADASLKGLRVYQAHDNEEAFEVPPPIGPKRYWTRRGLAAWLVETLDGSIPTLVGIDHGFSFPMRYFERYHLAPDWSAFLEDFCAHWPTDAPNTYVDFVRDGLAGDGAARTGERHWRRLTEEAAGAAKSIFHFDVQGSVAKSTHAGIPWLRHLRRERSHLHFWPFDGWNPKPGTTVIAEVYPRLWSGLYAVGTRSPDQHDAFAVATWMRDASRSGMIDQSFEAPSPEPIAATARVEGWILGTSWPPTARQHSTARTRRRRSAGTTQIGFVNRNGQKVIAGTDLPGTDHNQVVYVLSCLSCGNRYGANGSDIFHRRCPHCGAGRPGLPLE